MSVIQTDTDAPSTAFERRMLAISGVAFFLAFAVGASGQSTLWHAAEATGVAKLIDPAAPVPKSGWLPLRMTEAQLAFARADWAAQGDDLLMIGYSHYARWSDVDATGSEERRFNRDTFMVIMDEAARRNLI